MSSIEREHARALVCVRVCVCVKSKRGKRGCLNKMIKYL